MLTDNDPMPFGKYQGTQMGDVPAYYLMWLWDNDRCTKAVEKYIEENYDVLVEEAKKTQQTISQKN